MVVIRVVVTWAWGENVRERESHGGGCIANIACILHLLHGVEGPHSSHQPFVIHVADTPSNVNLL